MIAREEGGVVEPDDPHQGQHLVVVSFDPGVTTGWCSARYPIEVLMEQGVSQTLPGCEVNWGQIERRGPESLTDSTHVDDLLAQARSVWEEMVEEDEEGNEDLFAVVMERFDLRLLNSDPALLAPVRILSIFKDRMRTSPTPFFTQSPSDAKTTITDDRLRRWGLYRRESGTHARDAQRHNVLFARTFVRDAAVQERLGWYG